MAKSRASAKGKRQRNSNPPKTPSEPNKRSRQTTIATPTQDDLTLPSPAKVESLRKSAKAKGLATPSPGRANAAITMLQLTTGGATKGAPGSCSSNMSSRSPFLTGPSTIGDICQILTSYLGNRRTDIDLRKFSKDIACDLDRVVELQSVLQFLGIMHENTWLGQGNLKMTLERLVTSSSSPIKASCDLKTMDAAELFKIVMQSLAKRFGLKNNAPESDSPWTLLDVLDDLEATIPAFANSSAVELQKKPAIVQKLHECVSVLVALGIARISKTGMTLSEYQYQYKGVDGLFLIPVGTPDPSSMVSKQVRPSVMPPPASRRNNCTVTPVELMNKPTATPKSVQEGRRLSRNELRNVVRAGLKTRTLNSAISTAGGSSVDSTDSKASSSAALDSNRQPRRMSRTIVNPQLGKGGSSKGGGAAGTGTCVMPTRESGVQAKTFTSFTFSQLGIKPKQGSLASLSSVNADARTSSGRATQQQGQTYSSSNKVPLGDSSQRTFNLHNRREQRAPLSGKQTLVEDSSSAALKENRNTNGLTPDKPTTPYDSKQLSLLSAQSPANLRQGDHRNASLSCRQGSSNSGRRRGGTRGEDASGARSRSQSMGATQIRAEQSKNTGGLTSLAYFSHPLPVPDPSAGESTQSADFTQAVLCASSLSNLKAGASTPGGAAEASTSKQFLVPLSRTGCKFTSMPLPSEMLAYQTRCLKEFMKHYLIHYKRFDPNWVQHELTALQKRTGKSAEEFENMISSQDSAGSLCSASTANPTMFSPVPITMDDTYADGYGGYGTSSHRIMATPLAKSDDSMDASIELPQTEHEYSHKTAPGSSFGGSSSNTQSKALAGSGTIAASPFTMFSNFLTEEM